MNASSRRSNCSRIDIFMAGGNSRQISCAL
jgi:hypothetical protein